MQVVSKTNIKELQLVSKNKSCDVYALNNEKHLIIFTDRIDVFDMTLPEPMPGKGIILNQITNFWMSKFTHLVNNYVFERDLEKFPANLQAYNPILAGRSAIVWAVKPLPFKFHVVGNLIDEVWEFYQQTGLVGGQRMPRDLKEAERLERSVFLPISLGKGGSDPKWAQRMLGQKLFATIEETCLAIFGVARNYAAARGMLIADAWFEFAMLGGKPCLINEVMTPDCSTYWSADGFAPGQPQPSFEKQELQEWFDAALRISNPPPPMPKDLVQRTMVKYRDAFNIMTGKVQTLKKREEVAAQEQE